MRNERSSGFIVFRQENDRRLYLLLHYEAGHWDFVKGNIEDGEEELKAATRELKEEAGITDIKIVDGFRERIGYFYKRDGVLIRKEVIFFAGTTKESEVKLSFEHTGYVWADYDEAMKVLTYKTARNVLALAEKYMKQIA
ncbi:MAG: NUDIX domain-containing protein [Actinobacteria bacterium]|nr:NUDIX domain-containing protein [Actinomycetota bacterium]